MRYYLFLIILFLPLIGESQRLDSLAQVIQQEIPDTTRLKVLKDLCWGYAHSKPDKTIVYCNQMMEVLERLSPSDSMDFARANYYYGCAYKTKAEYEKSLSYFYNYKRIVTRKKDALAEGSVLYQIGVVNNLKGSYDKATQNYLAALEMYQSIDHKYSIATTLNTLANMDRKINQWDKAKARYFEALDIYIELEDYIGQADVNSNLGNLYQELKDYDTAQKYYLKQEELDKKIGYDIGLGYAYENLGNLYKEKGNNSLAKDYFEKSLTIRKQMDNKRSLAASYISYGKILTELKDFPNAKTNIDQGLNLSEENGILPELKEAYEALSHYYIGIGNAKSAIDNYELFMAVKDTILNRDVALRMNSIVAEYETKYAAEYESLEKEKAILQLNSENEKKDIRNLWMSIGLVLSILLAGIIFYFLKQRQKTNTLLNEKNEIISKSLEEKGILLKEMHHRVKNNLQVISSLLNLQSQYIEDRKAVEAINEGRNRVQSMALIHQSLYKKDNLVGIEAKEYFDKLINELFHTYKVDHDKILLEVNINDLQLDVDTMIPLGLIMNELVTNSLKYAFENKKKGKLLISLQEINHQLILKVEDDGIGMPNLDAIEQSDSFGYRLIDAFMAKMEGEINITSTNGTSITIVFNNYEIAR